MFSNRTRKIIKWAHRLNIALASAAIFILTSEILRAVR